MKRPHKAKPHGADRGASGIAKGRRANSETKHSPAEVMALCLLLHTCLVGAQRVIARMAGYVDWAPAGLIEAANMIDHAVDLVASIIASGGAQ